MSRINGDLSNILPTSRRLTALAYDFNNLVLYGLSLNRFLERVEVTTGALTQIGTTDEFGLGSMPGQEFNPAGLAYMSLGRVLDAPTGLMLTEAGGDITAAWDVVTNATDYVIEWREEGSGSVWQAVDVATPPHTFTP